MLGRVGNEDMGETKVKWNQRSMPPTQREKMFAVGGRELRIVKLLKEERILESF